MAVNRKNDGKINIDQAIKLSKCLGQTVTEREREREREREGGGGGGGGEIERWTKIKNVQNK